MPYELKIYINWLGGTFLKEVKYSRNEIIKIITLESILEIKQRWQRGERVQQGQHSPYKLNKAQDRNSNF